MAHLFGAEELHLEYPTKLVFKSVTLGVAEGDRIGIVGRNGDGKSTLLRILSKQMTADSGKVVHRGGLKIGMLGQTDDLSDDDTVSQCVVGDAAEHEWAGDARTREIISGLLGGVEWSDKIGELSGGQRRRVALAKLLIGDWDVIMLDEPTNHLDVQAIVWLAKHLNNRWPKNSGALLVVTHDRWFLDEISTQTWEVHDGVVDSFEGGYAAYILQRVERDRQASAKESRRQNLLKKELAWLRRGAPARSSKPKFRIDAANELIENVPPPRNKIQLSRTAMSRLGKRVVDVLDVDVEFQKPNDVAPKKILDDITWLIGPGDRFGLLGINGAGKSTLLKVITDDITPTNGHVRRGKTVKFAVLSQRLDELTEIQDERVTEVLARYNTTYNIDGKDISPTKLLERLGFDRTRLYTYVRDLSGGQKRRLQLLLILLNEPNVLIMDEPSNDLDTDMLTILEDLLDTWPGTLIVVSHDRYLLERVTDSQYALLGGKLRHVPGGVDEYLRLLNSSVQQEIPTESTPPKLPGEELSQAELRQLQKQSNMLERRIQKLNNRLSELEKEMFSHDHLDYEGLTDLGEKITEIKAKVDAEETIWLDVLEKLG